MTLAIALRPPMSAVFHIFGYLRRTMEYLEDANENDEELPAVFLEKTVPIK